MHKSQADEPEMYIIIRSPTKIDEVMSRCLEIEAKNESALWGMSYEQGVGAAIRWLTDKGQPHPLEVEAHGMTKRRIEQSGLLGKETRER